jgi:hypothetical protein
MAHKVQIQKITHVPFAKRLIIEYYLSQDCFDPSKGGWEYLPESCGYRGACSDNWIVMNPNTQHPLHSKNICMKGNYVYVWDYAGAFGLDPQEFDSNHSYIVYLGLVDKSCDVIDPCEGKYQTPSTSTTPGVEPAGTVGSVGDVNNTYNNCGPGYYLDTDPNGCFICRPIGRDTGITQPTGTGATKPTQPTSYTTFTGPTAPTLTTNWNLASWVRGSYAGGLEMAVPGNTPLGPGSSSFSLFIPKAGGIIEGSSFTNVSGQPPSYPSNARHTYLGLSLAAKSIVEKPNKSLAGTALGGRAPKGSIPRGYGLNALTDHNFRELTSPRNDDLQKASRVDQLNVSVHSLRLYNNIVVNNTIAVSARNSSSIRDAIEINKDATYIRFPYNNVIVNNIFSSNTTKNLNQPSSST